jgi:hypothetical protein
VAVKSRGGHQAPLHSLLVYGDKMKNNFTKTMVISFVVILVLALGAVAAFAQNDTTPDTDTTPALPSGPGGFRSFGGRPGHHDFGGSDDESLAAALGITVEELQAARQKVYADRLAQAVEDGYLTQEQADNMQAMNALKAYIDRQAILAEVLGMTAGELDAARDDGSLSDILANITPAELQERMQAATESAVQQAVADGVITQAQADLVLDQIANGAGMLGGFGGHHGRGGMDFGGSRGFSVPPAGELGNDALSTASGA